MAQALRSLIVLLLLAGCGKALPEHDPVTGGNARNGKALIARYGCGSCHTIRGVPGANATVAPSLEDIAKRVYLAGRLENKPETLEKWILDPRSVDPKTAMPKVGVDAAGARDIAAYLYRQ
ncbi:MAG TPA: c-type cytochrome [Burkholderiales bacterium]|nr:c-type cytochrome [Burkholderiales bacterium]